jgi:hypothetical protein
MRSNGVYEEFCLFGYNAMYCIESQLTVLRDMSPASLGSRRKPSKKTAANKNLIRVQIFTAWCIFNEMIGNMIYGSDSKEHCPF